MPRLFCLIAAVFACPVLADTPPSVADLVKQLSDPKFARREAAQKELSRRGEAIVPELDRLGRTPDAEAADRVGKIRYALVGYKDDIRRLLVHVDEGKDSAPVPIPDELRGLVLAHQPGSGDLLVSILADASHPLYRQALRTFVATWSAATADQIDSYVRQSVSLTSTHRRTFPSKVGALISFEAQLRDGWTGWPQVNGDMKFDFRTRTTRYLDGKPYGQPYEYPYPFATVGWFNVGEMAEGEHKISAVMEYEFSHRGTKRKGQIKSKSTSFDVASAHAEDQLIARSSINMRNLVRAALQMGDDFGPSNGGTLRVDDLDADAQPQVRWEVEPHKWAGLQCPRWMLSIPLKVDLCFEVEIRDIRTGKTCVADPICVFAGETPRGYLTPRDVRDFAGDRDGLVRVEVTLKPSRAVALTNPKVTSYFSEPIVRELRFRVFKQVPRSLERK